MAVAAAPVENGRYRHHQVPSVFCLELLLVLVEVAQRITHTQPAVAQVLAAAAALVTVIPTDERTRQFGLV